MNAMILLLPFLPLHAVHVLGKPDSYVGELVIFQTLGMLGGNLLLGYLGDRFGGKLLMVMGAGAFLAVCGATPLAGTRAGFRTVFLLLGASSYGWMLGIQVLALELAPTGRRSSFLAATGMARLVGMLGAYAVSACLPSHETGMGLRAALAGAATLASVLLLSAVEEPRKAAPAGALKRGFDP
jgi:MFS family permease